MATEHIVYIVPAKAQDRRTISLAEYQKKRVQRRRRVGKRMMKRFPLFAVEFMREEFPNLTREQLEEDMSRPSRRRKSQRRKKSPLTRYGRYPLYRAALNRYKLTGDQEALAEAQALRKRISKDFLFDMRCQGESRVYRLPATASIPIVQKIAGLKFSSWEELETKWAEVVKYGKR